MHVLVELSYTTCAVVKAIFWSLVRAVIGSPQKDVRGEVVLVTGAGSGLGRLLSVAFAQRGAVVVGWDVNASANEGTADIVRAARGRMHVYKCDVSSPEEVKEAAREVHADVGDVDILVNNAGIVSGKLLLDVTDDVIAKTIRVNLLAQMWTVQCFLPSMLERDHGHVINVASVAGLIGAPRMTDYCASKHGSVGFTDSLRYELTTYGRPGVHTTCVCPYFVDTGMFHGCLSRFPWLLPTLQPQPTVDRIMTAILTNEKMVYIPRTMYLLHILQVVLPVDAMMAIHKFLGATDFMTSFVGRQNDDSKKTGKLQ